MKANVFIGILSLSVLIFTGCFKADHSVRVKNSFSKPFSNVSIDVTSYGA